MRPAPGVAAAQIIGICLLLRPWCHSFQSTTHPMWPASRRPTAPHCQFTGRARKTTLDEASDRSSPSMDQLVEHEIEAEIVKSLNAVNAFNISTATNRGPPSLRREIELLISLNHSDDALPQLHELWNREKEPFAAPALRNDDGETTESSPRPLNRPWYSLTMSLQERRLLRQIQQHPRWPEPRIQLAQLYCRERRNLLQALEQCLIVLELKPWHADLAKVLMLLSLQRSDLAMALTWARLRLPKLKNSAGARRRRHAWVERAVAQAMEQLDAVEDERERARMKTTGSVISDDAWP